MTPQDELVDLLARLVGTLNDEDLADDPELSGLVAQLIQILNPKAAPLPVDVLEHLSAIENRMDRFKAAAEMLGATDPSKLKQLADSLREVGLLKSENDEDLKRAKKADLVTLPAQITGTNCANCKYVDIAKSYCNHKEVDQRLKDGAERMCCAFWDSAGTKREWDSGS